MPCTARKTGWSCIHLFASVVTDYAMLPVGPKRHPDKLLLVRASTSWIYVLPVKLCSGVFPTFILCAPVSIAMHHPVKTNVECTFAVTPLSLVGFFNISQKASKSMLLSSPVPAWLSFAAGTGKTLLAKAVAGEAGVPFFYR